MGRLGKKYQVNDYFYMKRGFKGLKENEKVKIVNVYKKGKDTIVDVKDINNNTITGVSVKMLRKRMR